jgi:hypothetical protein
MTLTHTAARYLADLFQPEVVEARDRMMFAMLRTLGTEPSRSFDTYGLHGLRTPHKQERR